jgi:hypothetical protein
MPRGEVKCRDRNIKGVANAEASVVEFLIAKR